MKTGSNSKAKSQKNAFSDKKSENKNVFKSKTALIVYLALSALVIIAIGVTVGLHFSEKVKSQTKVQNRHHKIIEEQNKNKLLQNKDKVSLKSKKKVKNCCLLLK